MSYKHQKGNKQSHILHKFWFRKSTIVEQMVPSKLCHLLALGTCRQTVCSDHIAQSLPYHNAWSLDTETQTGEEEVQIHAVRPGQNFQKAT
jgi:hypothetical protein